VSSPARPDYGQDAPGVVRNLAIAAAVCLALAAAAALRLVPSAPELSLGGAKLRFPLLAPCLSAGVAFTLTAAWMAWSSRVGKTAEREKLLDLVAWKGDERVLDVGCGRGLLLVGAAKRLTSGRAIGVDLWRTVDLAGNRPDAPLENAAIEGVAQRVVVQTADMRALPFEDGSFDVVVTRAAIHNLDAAADRDRAVREIARVLAPGGRLVLSDIRHLNAYRRRLDEQGCQTRLVGSPLGSLLCALVTMGSLRPNTLVATRRAKP
jgi:SAM-dependent methyltransferase